MRMNAIGISSIFLLSLFLGIANAQLNQLSISSLNITPQPIVAGSNITIAFQLYNSYPDALQNVNLQLEGTYPIVNYSPSWSLLIPSIGTGLYQSPNTLNFRLHIPGSVSAGTYALSLLATYSVYLSGSQTVSVNGQNVAANGYAPGSPSDSIMPISFYIRGSPSLKLTASPATYLSPGSQSLININVLNVGTDNATNVTINLNGNDNFSVIGASNFSLGSIAPQHSEVISATLFANTTITQKSSRIPVSVSYNTAYGQNALYSVSVPVSLSLGNPSIAVSVTNANPEILYPGSSQQLTVSIQNIGSGTAKNVTLSLISNRNITIGNSASKIFIGNIAPGASTSQNIFIIANKTDNQNKYSLPLQLQYQNANYNMQTNKTETLQIALQPSAQFSIVAENSSLRPGTTYGPLVLTVKNTGNNDAQSITFSLQTSYPISQVNPTAYISSLSPGQSKNVTFYIDVDPQGSPGQYPITMYEQWSQPNGATAQQYSSSQNYYIGVSNTPSYATYLLIIVIILTLSAVWYFEPKIKKLVQGVSQKLWPK